LLVSFPGWPVRGNSRWERLHAVYVDLGRESRLDADISVTGLDLHSKLAVQTFAGGWKCELHQLNKLTRSRIR